MLAQNSSQEWFEFKTPSFKNREYEVHYGSFMEFRGVALLPPKADLFLRKGY